MLTTEFLVGYSSEFLIFSTIVLYFVYKSSSKLKYNLPPSATLLNNFPILGYIPFVNEQTFHKEAAKLGPIVRYKFGPDDVVIVNDFDLIKEALTRDEFQDRPRNFLLRLIGNSEILVNWNGKLWRSQRNFSLRTLRTLGFGKSKFEGRVLDEIKYMTDKIDTEPKGNEIHIKKLIGPSVSNVIMLMTIGLRYNFDHPIRQTIDKLFLADRSNSFFTFYSTASHFTDTLRFLISLIPAFVIPDLKAFVSYVPNLLTKVTHERMKVVEQMSDHELSEPGDCFIDSYLKHLKVLETSNNIEHKEEKQYFTEDNGRASAQAFFAAGSATTKDAIEWALALLAVHQDVQDEMYQEIIRNIGTSGLVTINEKNDFPITESIIFEVMRYATQVPINLPHATSRDTTLGGYDIPKGTHIMTNAYAVHMNPKYWDEPEEFKYDRFLSKDRTKCTKKEALIPFGYGKRSCPGESMAMLEMFLYTISLVQKYKIQPANPKETIRPFINGIASNVHQDLTLKFVPRCE